MRYVHVCTHEYTGYYDDAFYGYYSNASLDTMAMLFWLLHCLYGCYGDDL